MINFAVMPRALFVVQHRTNRSPGQRFRHEQYLSHLEANGWECVVSNIIGVQEDKVLYKKGNALKKAAAMRKARKIRRIDAKRAAEFDVVFLFREALMTGSIAYERSIKAVGPKIIYDFDDAIWIQSVSEANKKWRWLKDPNKTAKLIALSDVVFAGNRYLSDYASTYNSNIKVFPTTIDTAEYVIGDRKARDKVVIGWSGSITTIQHFEFAIPILKRIQEKFGDKVEFSVIGDGTYVNETLKIKGAPWQKHTELSDLQNMDIGIMPLPDNEWARGKCGLKGLQYMGVGVATVMSPVGVNAEIIQDGQNGFLASEVDEWVSKLSALIEDKAFRDKIGAAGRQTVEEKYSVNAWKDAYLKAFNELIA